jgi:threonine aldolase
MCIPLPFPVIVGAILAIAPPFASDALLIRRRYGHLKQARYNVPLHLFIDTPLKETS